MSAQVVLAARDGTKEPSPQQLTSARLAEVEPDEAAARRVMSWWRDKGFDVGPLVGISFSVSGPAELFARHLHAASALAALAEGRSDREHLEIPTTRLPGPLRRSVAAVTFSAPPDFGPGNP